MGSSILNKQSRQIGFGININFPDNRSQIIRIVTICPNRANTLMEDKVAGRKFAVLSTYRDI